ncbi:hypothetical protein F4777DRAFT_172396 [Nemania sp. FL0916]|nr:hypothetical protein F4777DRAFT_172396 [Nemania sp. FL0916]
MDKLPQELLDRIVHYVGRRVGEESVSPWDHASLPFALPIIAAVSEKFQRAAERLTFNSLKVSTDPSDIDVFRRILTQRRRRYLRYLTVYLWVAHPASRPTRSDELRPFATDEERSAIDEENTIQLRELFNMIAEWPLSEPCLTLYVTGPERIGKLGVASDQAYWTFRLLDISSDLVDFPPLPVVKNLWVYNRGYHLHPHLALCLAAKMPNVTHVDWDLSAFAYDSWAPYLYPYRLWRNGLVQSIDSISLPQSVETFRFKMYVPEIMQNQEPPDFTGPDPSPDPFSSALRKLTKDCTEIFIDGSIHPSLFDPPVISNIASNKGTAPAWEKATHLDVRANILGADGQWLFQFPANNAPPDPPRPDPQTFDPEHLPPGYGTTESELDETEEFYDEQSMYLAEVKADFQEDWAIARDRINDTPMNKLLRAFARACAPENTPALRTALLHSDYTNNDNWDFQVVCYGAGTEAPSDWDAQFAGGGRDTWRFFFHHYQSWTPEESTLEAFRQVGRERNGRDAILATLPWGTFYD